MVSLRDDLQGLAVEMLANCQDYSPAAAKILSETRAQCAYGNEAWLVDTHGDIDMRKYSKIERIIPASVIIPSD